jgi:hypothetical protein
MSGVISKLSLKTNDNVNRPFLQQNLRNEFFYKNSAYVVNYVVRGGMAIEDKDIGN